MVARLTGSIAYNRVPDKRNYRSIRRLSVVISFCSLLCLFSNLILYHNDDRTTRFAIEKGYLNSHRYHDDRSSYDGHINTDAMSATPLPSRNVEEKYIYYNSHSGFNNQRISLENAILVSILLNATLIMPYAHIGKAIPWKPFPALFTTSKELEFECIRQQVKGEPLFGDDEDRPCLDYEELFDFQFVSKAIPTFKWMSVYEFMIRNGLQYGEAYRRNLEQFQKIWKGFSRHYDVINIEDYHNKAYQLFDSSSLSLQELSTLSELTGYKTCVDLHLLRSKHTFSLAAESYNGNYTNIKFEIEMPNFWRAFPGFPRPPRSTLYHFGSLFGSDRIRVISESQKMLQTLVKNNIFYRANSFIKALADPIINSLGGRGSFVGIHLRTQHGIFEKVIDSTIERVTAYLDNCLMTQTNCSFPNRQLGSDQLHSGHERTCYTPNTRIPSQGVPFVIFLATDTPANKLHTDTRLSRLLTKYPCVYTSNDFKSEILESFIQLGLSKRIESYLPFIEQFIVANSFKFFGTSKSTFSQFAQRLHSMWFPEKSI